MPSSHPFQIQFETRRKLSLTYRMISHAHRYLGRPKMPYHQTNRRTKVEDKAAVVGCSDYQNV